MNVTITSPFWKRRRDQIVESVIPYQWGVMNDEIDTTVPDDPAGNQLAAALRSGRAMRPVAFIDDDASIAFRVIAGLKVYKPKYIQQLIDETGAQEILLAIPSASRARRKEILQYLEGFPLHIRSVPDFMDLASGKVLSQDVNERWVPKLGGYENDKTGLLHDAGTGAEFLSLDFKDGFKKLADGGTAKTVLSGIEKLF